jgi:hypothetical protein
VEGGALDDRGLGELAARELEGERDVGGPQVEGAGDDRVVDAEAVAVDLGGPVGAQRPDDAGGQLAAAEAGHRPSPRRFQQDLIRRLAHPADSSHGRTYPLRMTTMPAESESSIVRLVDQHGEGGLAPPNASAASCSTSARWPMPSASATTAMGMPSP